MSRGVVAAAARLGHPAPDVVLAPLADGGEGTLDALTASSSGVGEIAARLLDDGAEEILLCIGGSATTDGGAGLISALGARFLDGDGEPLPPGGGALSTLATIDTSLLHPRARKVLWSIAVDVDNPLCGPRGAAAVFGPQKGATPDEVLVLDRGLAHLAEVVEQATGVLMVDVPGAGAAGGLAAVLVPFLGAEIVPGSVLVADAVGLAAALADADLVLTGEGSLDAQSLGGKVLHAVVGNAPATCAVVAIAGRVQLSAGEVQEAGLAAAFSIATGPMQLDELIQDAGALMEDAAAQVYGVFSARRSGAIPRG